MKDHQESRADVFVVLTDLDPEDLVGDLRRRLPILLDAPPASLVVDLSRLARLSSETVAALLWVSEACLPLGVPVRLRHVPRGGGAMLRRTGLAATLRVEGR